MNATIMTKIPPKIAKIPTTHGRDKAAIKLLDSKISPMMMLKMPKIIAPHDTPPLKPPILMITFYCGARSDSIWQ